MTTTTEQMTVGDGVVVPGMKSIGVITYISATSLYANVQFPDRDLPRTYRYEKLRVAEPHVVPRQTITLTPERVACLCAVSMRTLYQTRTTDDVHYAIAPHRRPVTVERTRQRLNELLRYGLVTFGLFQWQTTSEGLAAIELFHERGGRPSFEVGA